MKIYQREKEKEKKDKGSKGKGVKDWKGDEVSMLIELLEERSSLWDVFNKDYLKRKVKIRAVFVFGCNITSAKGKIYGLRAHYGCEIAKVNKTKSGESTDELYVSMQSLAFLQPVMKSSSSKNSLKQSNET